MGAWGIGHWIVVLLVVVLIFGTKKLKSMGGDLGGAVKGFKDGLRDGSTSSEEKPAVPAAQVGNASAEKTTIDVEARQKS